MALIAPFPYFGGKSKISPIVWQYFGDVDSYVEPFMGSLAVLLGRPGEHSRKIETVNDMDGYLANFWRAVQAAPDEVARWADWPVNEIDLTARHIWLVNEGRERIANLEADPDTYDAKVAGWWLWGICIWIGGNWCSGNGPWVRIDGQLRQRSSDQDAGRGVSRKRPFLGPDQGINRKRPYLSYGKGINRQLPHLGDAGRGMNREAMRTDPGAIYDYMRALSDRLRRVRVCCGDWQRVVTPGALAHGASVGVFLDPPYAAETGRHMRIYNHETEVSAAVREWAIANGDNPRYRIALCGYEGEHVMPESWHEAKWVAGASYKSGRGDQTGNRYRERVWFSPHCLQMPLWTIAS